ncbi:restriction endonuclease subunit S [Rhodococcus sp. 14-2470-1a]|uniref:restriction endonuclease subunit S n=1 Tax=Rhodococcus sp. 14-2470-1a TaxID=2023150 RepID=UPI0015C594F8|nr:restriction endonuclease subunit S [Rhodococcus sp. 14-2470-1a]
MTAVERVPLGQLLRRAPRYGINAAAVPLKPNVPTYIRITDIDDDGRFAPSPKVGVAHPASGNYILSSGELVFARTGASVGKSYLYNPDAGQLVYAGFLINVAPDSKLLNPKFLSLYVQTKEYWDWIARTSVRSGQPGVNGQEYAQLPVPLPNITVQNAIADTMGDLDDLIATLERLITKKQAIKQGMMQQLLTGRTRLPGFTEPWGEPSCFDELCTRLTGFWGESRAIAKAPHRVQVITAGDISPKGHLKGAATRFFSSAQLAKARCIRDDLVVTSSGNGLGKTAYIDEPGRLAASNFVRILRPRRGVSGLFLAQLMRTSAARDVLDSNTATSAYPNLLPGFFTERWIPHPSFDEQLAIAAVLRDTDREVAALQKRRAKARAIKTGMMQQLLTGRTRLPVEVAT